MVELIIDYNNAQIYGDGTDGIEVPYKFVVGNINLTECYNHEKQSVEEWHHAHLEDLFDYFWNGLDILTEEILNDDLSESDHWYHRMQSMRHGIVYPDVTIAKSPILKNHIVIESRVLKSGPESYTPIGAFTFPNSITIHVSKQEFVSAIEKMIQSYIDQPLRDHNLGYLTDNITDRGITTNERLE